MGKTVTWWGRRSHGGQDSYLVGASLAREAASEAGEDAAVPEVLAVLVPDDGVPYAVCCFGFRV